MPLFLGYHSCRVDRKQERERGNDMQQRATRELEPMAAAVRTQPLYTERLLYHLSHRTLQLVSSSIRLLLKSIQISGLFSRNILNIFSAVKLLMHAESFKFYCWNVKSPQGSFPLEKFISLWLKKQACRHYFSELYKIMVRQKYFLINWTKAKVKISVYCKYKFCVLFFLLK